MKKRVWNSNGGSRGTRQGRQRGFVPVAELAAKTGIGVKNRASDKRVLRELDCQN